MKTKLLILTSLLILLAFSAQAGDTNITVKVTVEMLGVATNNTSLNLTYATAKDRVMIDGISYTYNAARAGGYTNTLDTWYAKVKIKDNAKLMADDYNRVNSVATLQKLTELLTINIDMLSAVDLNSLNTIAAKNPVP